VVKTPYFECSTAAQPAASSRGIRAAAASLATFVFQYLTDRELKDKGLMDKHVATKVQTANQGSANALARNARP
jgi:hypothetical protein